MTYQPVHTVYVPADRFTATTVEEWGAEATRLLHAHAPTSAEISQIFGVKPEVFDRVARKLAAEPVEDLRIDFEDGYGTRPGQEDADAERAVESLAAMDRLPRRWGLRVKSHADDGDRSARTLDLFVNGVVKRFGGLPEGFTVTYPKVLREEHLTWFAGRLELLEESLGLPRLRFEMQVEAPETLRFLRAGLHERLSAAHFGVFDYTAAIGLPPHEQRLDHPACDHARDLMQVAFAGTGVELSDGSLASSPASDSGEDVRALWRRHSELVTHSLSRGFYQGWDMHPSHLVSRFATVYGFHLERYDEYAARVRAWEERRQVGGVMDEPATIKTLAAALARADAALTAREEPQDRARR